ncbi:MAG: Rieske 2Fe-2S domain-containing protein [Chromatiales bacterium]|nr:Rieske 2Fe-2S domain-containing protein [Chromatiales bacterium]
MRAPKTVGWHPIAASDDLPPRHVFQGELWGQELVAWRADDDFVNVWENRCLHRGVRLSIGTNLGSELQCRYHGWRYANRSAGCTYIPAHPADAPARTICNRTFPAIERYGLVWTSLDPHAAPLDIVELAGEPSLALREIAINASPDQVIEALSDFQFPVWAGDRDKGVRTERSGPHSVVAHLPDGEDIALFVQPVDAGRAVIRGVMASSGAIGASLQALHLHDAQLCALRDHIEGSTTQTVTPQSLREDPSPAVKPTSSLVVGKERSAALRVVVAERQSVAPDVMRFRLEPIDGTLPAFQAGAHLDLHLSNGLVRQYSITNGPQETAAYVIGVKREPDSRGGSSHLHDNVKAGDVIDISEPRNNFPLRRDALHTVLIAGGIGITPILSMARTLSISGLAFELHHFVRGAQEAPFAKAVASLGAMARTHIGLNASQTSDHLASLLDSPAEHRHVYICGPGPMIDVTRQTAQRLGWPEGAVHYEHFKNATDRDASMGFEIVLARSGITLEVPPGKTIVEVLRENNVGIVTSCEQGACGTCKVAVLGGQPLHQDVYLNTSERSGSAVIMACVSRAQSERLVLDL